MVVKKKVRQVQSKGDSMGVDLDDERLQRVRAAITTINTDEGEIVMTAKKKGAAAANSEAKKADKKAASAKPDAKANGKGTSDGESNMVSLAQLCEELAVTPAAARRRMRAAEKGSGGVRYEWAKGSKELAAAKEAIAPTATAAE